MSKGEDISDYREVTPQQKASLEKHDAGFVEPGRWLLDKAGANEHVSYNEKTGLFAIGEVTDITTEQMIRIFSYENIPVDNLDYAYLYALVRTILPLRQTSGSAWYGGTNLFATFLGCGSLEYIDFGCTILYCKLMKSTFLQCSKLRKIITPIGVDLCTFDKAFKQCASLEYVRLKGLKSDVSFEDSPLLSLDSLAYMVDNAVNTKPITITVHPEVFARLNDEGNAEWYKVLTDGAEKNIIFATT